MIKRGIEIARWNLKHSEREIFLLYSSHTPFEKFQAKYFFLSKINRGVHLQTGQASLGWSWTRSSHYRLWVWVAWSLWWSCGTLVSEPREKGKSQRAPLCKAQLWHELTPDGTFISTYSLCLLLLADFLPWIASELLGDFLKTEWNNQNYEI